MGVTIARGNDRRGGYIHLGRSGGESTVYGGLYYGRGSHHGSRRHGYGRYYGRGYGYDGYYGSGYGYGGYLGSGYGLFYSGYRSIPYYGSSVYDPWFGYTYSSIYYPSSYVYLRRESPTVYIVDDDYAQADVVYQSTTSGAAASSPPVSATSAGAGAVATYPTLTDAGDFSLVGRGNAEFFAGQYNEARRLYVSAMLADERDGYAKFLYSLANFAAGDYEVAGMALRRAMLTTADLIEYPVNVYDLYDDRMEFDGQLSLLARYADTHPEDRSAMLLLGYLDFASGLPVRALHVLDRLTALDENDTMAALLRDAVVRVSEGDKQ